MPWFFSKDDKDRIFDDSGRMMDINQRNIREIIWEKNYLEQQKRILQQEREIMICEKQQFIKEQERLKKDWDRLVLEQEQLKQKQLNFQRELEEQRIEQKLIQTTDLEERNLYNGKKQLQEELNECSKKIREMQQTIKILYQFEPCRELCELSINMKQGVYQTVEEIREDLECVIEAFDIKRYEVQSGEIFDVKYHEQVYSNVQDARGREIDKVYSNGYSIDGEIICKAQVSVKQQ